MPQAATSLLLPPRLPLSLQTYLHSTAITSDFWEQEVRLQLGDFNVFSHAGHPMSLLSFINDALMAIFFFSIGLEIKREVLVGELSSFKQALLPIIGAIGGMIVPVLIFYYLSRGTDYAGRSSHPHGHRHCDSRLAYSPCLASECPFLLKYSLPPSQ